MIVLALNTRNWLISVLSRLQSTKTANEPVSALNAPGRRTRLVPTVGKKIDRKQ